MNSTAKQKKSLDMTQGSPTKLIILFSLPLIAGNMLQQLYNTVDSIVVGRFVGETALAAVGVAFPVIFLLSSLFMGIGSGAMVMVSQYFGGNEQKNLNDTIDTLYTSLIVGAIPLTLVGVFFANPILNMVNVPADARSEAYTYMIIVMLGIIGSLGYNCNAGILQGLGDTRTTLLFLAIACGINIGLDILLVVVFKMGVAGVALATVIAQIFSWLFGIFYINKKYPQFKIRPFSFRFNKKIFKQIIRLGVPSGIQQSLFSVGIIMMTRLVNSYGSTFSAGFNASNKIDTFVFLPIQSMAMAVTAYTGQNMGAGKVERVRKGARAAIVLSVIFSIAGLCVIPLGPYIMRLFSDNPEVISSGMAFLKRIVPFYWLLSFQFVFMSVIRGAGEPWLPMISSLVAMWLARVPSAYLLSAYAGRDNMFFCYAIGWVFGLLISSPYYFSGKWKRKALTTAGSTDEERMYDLSD